MIDELVDFEDYQDAPDEPGEDVVENIEQIEVHQQIDEFLERRPKDEPEQGEFDLLPSEPPKPVTSRTWTVVNILARIGDFNPGVPPTKEFLRSIETWGIREPIVLTVDDRDNYRIRDGRRRLQAAIILEIKSVPVKVYDLNSVSAAALTIDSNIQRSSNPLVEYEAIVEFMSEAQLQGRAVSVQDIHYATGMPVQTIHKRMKLAKLHGDIMEGVKEKKVAFGTAEAIASLPVEKQEQLAKFLEYEGRIKGSDVAEVKKVQQSESFDQLVSLIKDAPPIEAGHSHAFKIAIEGEPGHESFEAVCECGRVCDSDEIRRTLNTYID